MSTLQAELESKLNSSDGNKAIATWYGHFEALADADAQEQYKRYRTKLNRFLGRFQQAGYRPWIPIGAIKQGVKALSIKCQGRKVAIARFPKNEDFTISFTKLARNVNPANASAVIEQRERIPYRDTVVRLKKLPETSEFQEGVRNYPEWRLEAWLAKRLDATQTERTGAVFKNITPLKYCEMLLQVSSPFSASRTTANGVEIAVRANGHSDILVRRGTGRNSRFGVLELKAVAGGREEANRINIKKALCQAFAYAYCYLHAWQNLPKDSIHRRSVLSVLGYENPAWVKSPPPLDAVAVVPKEYADHVITDARERGLFCSAAVKEKKIKLWLWTYKITGDEYEFDKIKPASESPSE
jgi:hypothetical protein